MLFTCAYELCVLMFMLKALFICDFSYLLWSVQHFGQRDCFLNVLQK